MTASATASAPAPAKASAPLSHGRDLLLTPQSRITNLQTALDSLTMQIADQRSLFNPQEKRVRLLQDQVRLVASQIRSYEKLEALKKDMGLKVTIAEAMAVYNQRTCTPAPADDADAADATDMAEAKDPDTRASDKVHANTTAPTKKSHRTTTPGNDILEAAIPVTGAKPPQSASAQPAAAAQEDALPCLSLKKISAGPNAAVRQKPRAKCQPQQPTC
ncbi:hypothetical protein [Parvularcula sp. IMCC14364]|uniref:hypothetical protein n=1 Tax=Parvularcula sp. IMCC14364 TaxID=3067902 RepID=UPI00274093BD|nr:hypothetical protein [Parvularcula sp. IMCC14364]